MMERAPVWAQKVINAHLAVTDQVSHGGRLPKSERYFVWMEDAGDDLLADNGHCEKAITGTTDLFTKAEFDPWKDAIEAAFDAAGLLWHWIDTLYEDDTGFWHYVWNWAVM